MFHGMLQIFTKNHHRNVVKIDIDVAIECVCQYLHREFPILLRSATDFRDFRELTSDQLKNSHCVPLGFSAYPSNRGRGKEKRCERQRKPED